MWDNSCKRAASRSAEFHSSAESGSRITGRKKPATLGLPGCRVWRTRGTRRKPRRAARRRASFVHSRGATVARAACQPLASHPRRNQPPRIQVPARANVAIESRRIESSAISIGRHPSAASHGVARPNAAGACSTAGSANEALNHSGTVNSKRGATRIIAGASTTAMTAECQTR